MSGATKGKISVDNNACLSVLESGSSVNGNAATSNFTSDEIPMEDKPWSIVFSIPSLAVTGLQPRVTIEGSNDPDLGANNWERITNGRFIVPRSWKSRFCEFSFIRIVYESRGVTAGTIEAHINQKMNVER